MNKIAKLCLSVLMTLGSVLTLDAQNVGIKSNLISDALLSPNVGLEIGLAPKWTFNVSGQINAWTVDGHKWKHWLAQPEIRYWFCQRFGGHFLGLHALGGQYNFGHLGTDFKFLGSDFSRLKDNRYQGWGVGAGIGYGYAWPVAKHWNIEAEIGVGWIYTRYDKYPCAECGKKLQDNRVHNYVGPTKAAVNVEYLF
ncbi:MAG: DUF3575 domain-containing protein [Muribaculum sp.]|nr:DUF3575 domain-containing protein [Muribaculum sp.]